jgi:flagellar motor switch protein FliM
MNEPVQTILDKELSELPVEAQIIAASKSIYRPLPMMEALFFQFEEPLTHTLNEYTSCKSEVTLKSFEYMSYAEAMKKFSPPNLFGVIDAKPWGGSLAIAAEPNLIMAMLQTMLGGQPSSKLKKPRNFTSIEKRITTKLYDVTLRELARKFSEVTGVTFQIETLEEDKAELNFAPVDSSCVKVSMEILLEGQGGLITFIIPYIAFETVEPAFSQPFHGGDISGKSGWRGAITKSLQNTDIELVAILQELTVPLHQVLAWRPGQILDIGIDTEHELLVTCSSKRMFQAAMGCRKNGSVALRISKILNEVES